jgi:hypothetical protein
MIKRCITYTIGQAFFLYDGRFPWLAPFQCPCSFSAIGAVHGVVNNAIFVNMPRLAKTGDFSLKRCERTGMGIFKFEMGNLRNGNLIGRNVGRFRYQQGWTQEELAATMQLLGCYMTRDIIANIESRRSSANDRQIAFLAEALNVAIGDLFPPDRPSDRSR